jgi:meso-butanediol dehydrogenase / (S,S)-butanediol dehydrogenase / diacetyl reductase
MFDPSSPAVSPDRFRDKVALVTGAASGIGRATARRLAAEGAAVWCADINAAGVGSTEADIIADGGRARSSVVDVTDPAACAGVVADTVAAFGGIDVLANIAGIGGMRHFADETPDRLVRMFQVNAGGPFQLIQAALPHLLERQGNVLNLASTAGLIGQAYVAAYCASKHALVGLTRALAIELGRQGVRFNAVCPGGVNTGLLSEFVPPEGASMSLVSRSFLTRDMQEPESVAAMIAYVCSDEAYYVNGAILSIDGGTTAG